MVTRRVDRRSPLMKKIRDGHFYIDYLRLHKYGKQEGYWKKNRYMLTNESELTGSEIPKKGYQAYVQRVFKDIVDKIYPDFDVIKPRGVFGYEIGKKNDNTHRNSGLDFATSEDKIKFILATFMSNGSHSDVVEPYRQAIMQAEVITTKNREAGLKIVLDTFKSKGWKSIQDLLRIREAQDAILERFEDKDLLLKIALADGMIKAVKYREGDTVRHRTNPNLIGVIASTPEQRNNYRGAHWQYQVRWSNGREEVTAGENLIPSTVAERHQAMETLDRIDNGLVNEYEEAIITYATENFGSASGLSAEQKFTLSKSALVKEAGRDSNRVHGLRSVENTDVIIGRINTQEEPQELDAVAF